MKNKILSLSLILLLAVTVISCAPSQGGGEYGFLGGLWHGIIFPISLSVKILSIILHIINHSWGNWNIGLYADNTTFNYWVGYIIGLVIYGIPALNGE